jgi:hypothetical protein
MNFDFLFGGQSPLIVMLACERTAALVFPAVSLRANCLLRLAEYRCGELHAAGRCATRCGSRLMQPSKKALPFRCATFRCFFTAALKAVLPAIFNATNAPDHHPKKQLNL